MKFTNEEILEIGNSINKVINALKKVIDEILKTAEKVWNVFKEFLNKKIAIRTKQKKKGKKYIHSYIKVSFWNLLQRYGYK